MPTKPTYEIYCLYHNQVNKKYYGNQIDQVTFVKMDRGPYIFKSKKHIHLVNESWFHSIGKEWAEYEFYYSLYQGYKKGLIELPEYLGFIQYDMEFKGKEDKYKNTSVIDFVEGLIDNNKLYENTLISFCSRNFYELYDEHYILDPKRPKVWSDRKFENCLDTIIREYNYILKKDLNLCPLKEQGLDMCSSFFINRNTFIEIMKFISLIIEDGRLKCYIKEERRQGCMAEIYTAVFIGLMGLKKINFSIIHYFLTGTANNISDDIKNKNISYELINNTKDKFYGLIGIVLKSKFPKIYKILKPYFPDK